MKQPAMLEIVPAGNVAISVPSGLCSAEAVQSSLPPQLEALNQIIK
jgi:hypothetical protein